MAISISGSYSVENQYDLQEEQEQESQQAHTNTAQGISHQPVEDTYTAQGTSQAAATSKPSITQQMEALEKSGQSPSEIAANLGLPVSEVDSTLDLTTTATTAATSTATLTSIDVKA